jgi:hypothetical protein
MNKAVCLTKKQKRKFSRNHLSVQLDYIIQLEYILSRCSSLLTIAQDLDYIIQLEYILSRCSSLLTIVQHTYPSVYVSHPRALKTPGSFLGTFVSNFRYSVFAVRRQPS